MFAMKGLIAALALAGSQAVSLEYECDGEGKGWCSEPAYERCYFKCLEENEDKPDACVELCDDDTPWEFAQITSQEGVRNRRDRTGTSRRNEKARCSDC